MSKGGATQWPYSKHFEDYKAIIMSNMVNETLSLFQRRDLIDFYNNIVFAKDVFSMDNNDSSEDLGLGGDDSGIDEGLIKATVGLSIDSDGDEEGNNSDGGEERNSGDDMGDSSEGAADGEQSKSHPPVRPQATQEQMPQRPTPRPRPVAAVSRSQCHYF